jgi:hypothetical protein
MDRERLLKCTMGCLPGLFNHALDMCRKPYIPIGNGFNQIANPYRYLISKYHGKVFRFMPKSKRAKSFRILISLPDKFLGEIDLFADEEQRTRSELIREALRYYIKDVAIEEELNATN